MTIQVYVDESGIDRAGPILAFAAVISSAKKWLALSDQWKAVLDKPPSIKKFSMREAKGRLMKAKLEALIPVMNAHPFLVLERVDDLKAFEEILKPMVHPPLNQPYFWMFTDVILRAAGQVRQLGQTEPFEIIFDENVQFGPKAKAWYPLFREITKARAPEIYAMLPVDPLFRTDDEFMPLQVADIFAWLCRRNVSGATHEFAWVTEQLRPQIQFSTLSGGMTRHQLAERVRVMMTPAVREQTAQFLRDLGMDSWTPA